MYKVYIEDVSYLSDEKLFDQFLQKASKDRQEKVNALVHPNDKRLSLGAYVLLQKAMSEKEYKYSNISHSGTKAMVVVSDNPVGCDIQKIENYKKRVAERFYTLDEQKFVGDSKERFYYIWVRKESYVKLLGTGIKTPFESFSVLKLKDLFYDVKTEDGYYAVVCENSRIEK